MKGCWICCFLSFLVMLLLEKVAVFLVMMNVVDIDIFVVTVKELV